MRPLGAFIPAHKVIVLEMITGLTCGFDKVVPESFAGHGHVFDLAEPSIRRASDKHHISTPLPEPFQILGGHVHDGGFSSKDHCAVGRWPTRQKELPGAFDHPGVGSILRHFVQHGDIAVLVNVLKPGEWRHFRNPAFERNAIDKCAQVEVIVEYILVIFQAR